VCVCVREREYFITNKSSKSGSAQDLFITRKCRNRQFVLCFDGSLTNSLLKPPEEKSRYAKRAPEECVFYSAET